MNNKKEKVIIKMKVIGNSKKVKEMIKKIKKDYDDLIYTIRVFYLNE